MARSTHDELAYEQMLLTRAALQGTPAKNREWVLDRSAAVLIARLEASGPLSVGELAEAFGLDVSTVHRQVAAALRTGLVERIPDPDGGPARKHRPTAEGSRRFGEEMAARAASFRTVTADWTPEEVDTFVALMRSFNEGIEALRGQPWPRS
ncbi:MarR family winged helix-turn-helix transcriptional regulator [Citricoccus sp. NPDC079358]|uniref:MarR family winged helix-turn-helix transcriptional regulator n=1 Tax=unclassified Citricoccus TaxID=2632435 RepID=UPI0012EFD107|nr:MarR family winged helix-turn-helix transcriptional regulator [Citricoccus sp. K5]VXB89153.1 Transcriptional regulator [Citricoccus sp. K5]